MGVEGGLPGDADLERPPITQAPNVHKEQAQITNCARLYRLRLTPWERYGRRRRRASRLRWIVRRPSGHVHSVARSTWVAVGEGSPDLARRGWKAVGIDFVPSAIEAAKSCDAAGATCLVGDVTKLESADLGAFDFFLGIGCFQDLDADQRSAERRGVTALGKPNATLLMLAFGPTRVGGASQAEVEEAFPQWEMLTVEPAETAGLGWPMNRTTPQWYRLGRGETTN